MGHGISRSRCVTACERRWVTGSPDRRRCDLQGAREGPARGGSRLARGGGSRLEIFSSATVRSPGCERETGSRVTVVISRSAMVNSSDRVRELERDRLEVGGFVRGEAGLGWLGVAGRAEKESRKRGE